VKLVQMPRDLLHVDETDLPAAGVLPGLVPEFRAYHASVLNERRGLAILVPPTQGGRAMLMVLARRIGTSLRDANIRRREQGEDLRRNRQKLCYLPGSRLAEALATPETRDVLLDEAACFIQDLEAAWVGKRAGSTLAPETLFDFLDERLAFGRPTFVSAAPRDLPHLVERGLRSRLCILEQSGP
jgi:hypothetical protein